MPVHMLSWQTNAHDATSCHAPWALHVWRLVPPQRFAPGMHSPPHPFSVQSLSQRTGVSHVPIALHVEVIPA
jgi:hypothetical protein